MSAFRPFIPVTRDFNAPSAGIVGTPGIPTLPGRRTDAQLSNLTNTMANPFMPTGSNSLTRIDANLPALSSATTLDFPSTPTYSPVLVFAVIATILFTLG